VILLLVIMAIVSALTAVVILARTYGFARIWRAALRATPPLRLWFLFGAGPALHVSAALLVLIVWKGDWPVALREKQLTIIGVALCATLALIAVVFSKIAGIKVKGSGPLGTNLEIDGSDDQETGGPTA
jgi:hypothetical protein